MVEHKSKGMDAAGCQASCFINVSITLVSKKAGRTASKGDFGGEKCITKHQNGGGVVRIFNVYLVLPVKLIKNEETMDAIGLKSKSIRCTKRLFLADLYRSKCI